MISEAVKNYKQRYILETFDDAQIQAIKYMFDLNFEIPDRIAMNNHEINRNIGRQDTSGNFADKGCYVHNKWSQGV